MTAADSWLKHYGDTHDNLAYPFVYWAAVPMFVLGLVGQLWLLPVPAEFEAVSPLLNWGSAFLMAAAVYYFVISVSLAIGMLPFLMGVASLQLWLAQSDYSATHVTVGLLAAGIAGIWLGHRNEPGIRPVLRDLQLAMIGPAWLLSVLYRRVGIPI